MAKTGRKNKYDQVIVPRLPEIKKLISEGWSEKNIARHLGIAYSTWNKFKKNKKEFSELVSKARCKPVEEIEEALIKSAKGYSYPVQKAMKLKEVIYDESTGKRIHEIERIEYYTEIVHVPASVQAGIFLLTNWDKQHYSKNPAELEQRKKEFEFTKEMKEF